MTTAFSFYKLVGKQALNKTFEFLGWEREIKFFLRSFIAWIIVTLTLYRLNPSFLGEEMTPQLAPIMAVTIMFLLVYIFYFIKIPADIFYQQKNEIISFKAQEKNIEEKKEVCRSLERFFREGENVLKQDITKRAGLAVLWCAGVENYLRIHLTFENTIGFTTLPAIRKVNPTDYNVRDLNSAIESRLEKLRYIMMVHAQDISS